MKECNKCGKLKNLLEFPKVSRNKDGLSSRCLRCKTIQDDINKFVKARRSNEYIHEQARQAAVNAIHG